MSGQERVACNRIRGHRRQGAIANATINTKRAEFTSPAIEKLRMVFMSGIPTTCIRNAIFWQLYRYGFMSNDTNIERFYELAMSGAPEKRSCVFHAQGRQDFFMSGAGKLYE